MEITGSLSLSLLPPSPIPLWDIHHGLHLERVKICHVFILLEISQKSQLQDFFFPHKTSPSFFFFPPLQKTKKNNFFGGEKVRAQLLWELIPCLCQAGCSFQLSPSSPVSAGKVGCQQGHAQRHKAILTSWALGSRRAGASLGLAALVTADSLGSRPSFLPPADSALIWLRSGRLLQLSLSMTDLAGVDGDISWVWQLELWWC